MRRSWLLPLCSWFRPPRPRRTSFSLILVMCSISLIRMVSSQIMEASVNTNREGSKEATTRLTSKAVARLFSIQMNFGCRQIYIFNTQSHYEHALMYGPRIYEASFFCHIIHNIAKHMPYFLPIQYHCSHMNTIPNIKRPKPNLRYPVIHIKKLAYSIQPPSY